MLLIGALVTVVTWSSHGQGSVAFGNNISTRVYMTNPDGTTTLVPVGNRFLAELVFAPDGTAPGEFGTTAVRLGAPASFGPVPGVFNGGGRTAAGVQPSGGFGLFQVRVWESAAGPDYVTAVATGNPQYQAGTSLIMRIDTADPTTTPPGVPTQITAYLTSFVITPIPEPSVIALGLAGVGALLLFRRRK